MTATQPIVPEEVTLKKEIMVSYIPEYFHVFLLHVSGFYGIVTANAITNSIFFHRNIWKILLSKVCSDLDTVLVSPY